MTDAKEVLIKIANHRSWQWVHPYDAEAIIEALGKQVPKKPILKERRSLIHINKGDKPHEWIDEKYKDWCCPICDRGVGEQYVPRNHGQRKMDYCPGCGQRIDWN